ncbi:MAG TPA: plastocyanin/azurin family copper-binding protein [Solirubrobacteraceae bacterium]|nr:plastocyanin/azurin family copper-binding protein [Solirubrobacteraceae bacterium]
MHSLAMQLAPILAAEKSKVPFYVAGGVLVAWALIVSLALGLRRPRFPGGPEGERGVIAISVVLVLAAVVSAVLTSGAPTTAKAAVNLLPAPAPNPSVPAVAASAAAPSSAASQPAAPTTTASEPAAPSRTASQPTAPTTTASTSPAPSRTASQPAAPAAAVKQPPRASARTLLKLAANPTGLLRFDTKQLSAKAGAVTITFANASPIEHDVTLSQGATVLGATPIFTGGSKTLTINLKPGTYTFYCSVPGHRQAGMEGTLKVS